MDKFKFTQKGLAYIAQAADGCTVAFTKGKYGDGSPPVDVLSLTDLVNAKGDLTIANKTVDGNQVTIKTSFTNAQSDGTIAESFYLREVGLFGKLLNSSGDVQGEETLLIYACATDSDPGDYISQNSPTEFVINFSFAVSDSDNLTLSVDLDAYALKSDLEVVESEISDLQNGTGLNDGAVTNDKIESITGDKISDYSLSEMLARLNALTDTCYLTVTVITVDDPDTSYGKIKYSVSGTWNDDTAAVISQDIEEYQEINEDLGVRIYFIKDTDTYALSCRLEYAGTSGYTNEPSDIYIDINDDYMHTGTHVYTYTFKKEH